MAHDIRRICFSPPQVLAAISDYALSQKSLADHALAIRSVRLEAGPYGPVAHLVARAGPAADLPALDHEKLLKALVMFCLKQRIAIPARGIKTVELVAHQLALFIRRIHPGDPYVQDWVMNGPTSASHVTDDDWRVWESDTVAHHQDVRAVLFSLSEIHQAVADHLVRATGYSQLGQFEKLIVERGEEGVSGRVIFPKNHGVRSRILPAADLRDVVIAFCRSKKIPLPAATPKRLAIISEERLSLVITQPRIRAIARKIHPASANPV